MSIIKDIKSKVNSKVIVPATIAMATMVPTVVHAAEAPDMTGVLTTSVQSIVTNTLSAISAVAPIGITVFASMFVWKKGLKFFKQTSNQ